MSEPFQGSLTEHAYYSIRDRILRGELPFGAGLSRRVLAEQMRISIVPVGDALQRLENDGLVESRPRVGTRVRIPTAKAIRGHYILREALESQAARIFAEKSSASEREEIKRLAAQLDIQNDSEHEGDISREKLYEVHKFHLRFHMRIAECTGCDELCQAIEKNQVLVFNWLYDTALGNQRPPAGWHADLAAVLGNGDPDAADSAMRRHTRFRMDEVLQRMEPYFSATESQLATYVRRPRRSAKSKSSK
ncbi:MAG TPA: GntR family transcriptional regulator [Bryobacteraceae bacterium]|jgi:DNA-binding GntR family transcriptional regulator